MRGESPEYIEALVTNADKIVFTGPLAEAVEAYPEAKTVDLNGQTLLPGFIDGHSHFAGFPGQSVGA